jgi:DNA-binding IclR family transcriptional regulator
MQRGLEQATERTVTSTRALRRELSAVRRQGYALSWGEAISRSPGIGVPLRDEDGTVFAGLAIVFLEREFNERGMLKHLPALRSTAADISKLLTYDSFVRYMQHAGHRPVFVPARPASAPADRGNMPLVRSVSRAIGITAALWNSQSGMSVSELARERGLDDSTVQRLACTLVAEGMIRRHPESKRYQVAPVLWLRNAPFILGATSLQETVSFVLERLAHHSGATAGLLCPDASFRKAVVCSFKLPPNPVHFRAPPDDHPPLHATAAGKCWLAACSPSHVERYIVAGLEVRTEHTITTVGRLQQELAAVREQGYAVTREESTPGICGLAVPIHNAAGEMLCAVSLAPVVSSFTEDNIQRWLPQLRVAAQALSRVLTPGWSRVLMNGQRGDSEAASTQHR